MSDRGFMFPRSATGRASLLPPPPWHYSGAMLTLEYRTDPEAVAELIPPGLEPADEDPGAVAVIWADWQSCSDTFEEILDPVRAQYREVFFVIRCKYRGRHYSRCAWIWVDSDYAMVRGHHQGYPKKLGSIFLTRPSRWVGPARVSRRAGGSARASPPTTAGCCTRPSRSGPRATTPASSTRSPCCTAAGCRRSRATAPTAWTSW